jgi:hypothetical protein
MQVDTLVGRVDIAHLEVRDVITLTENARLIQTEWTLKSTGQVVRRDGVAQVLRGVEAEPSTGA